MLVTERNCTDAALVSEPTDSSGWTGPSSAVAPRLRGALVHRYGEHQVSTDFARLVAQADAESKAKQMPPELLGVVGRAWLLLASPLLLVVANQIVHSTGRDLIVQDNKAYLFAWTSAVAALALSQMVSKSLMLIWGRKAILVGATLATLGFAGGYVYIAAKSRQGALASTPERTYELYRTSGRGSFRRTEIIHQRADGTLLGGGRWEPAPYAKTCALVQRLQGQYGFTWVRVLERSRPPGRTELHWPVRREECFSDTPLSSLPR